MVLKAFRTASPVSSGWPKQPYTSMSLAKRRLSDASFSYDCSRSAKRLKPVRCSLAAVRFRDGAVSIYAIDLGPDDPVFRRGGCNGRCDNGDELHLFVATDSRSERRPHPRHAPLFPSLMDFSFIIVPLSVCSSFQTVARHAIFLRCWRKVTESIEQLFRLNSSSCLRTTTERNLIPSPMSILSA